MRWKKLKEYPGYSVSDTGLLKGKRVRIMKPHIKKGYAEARLWHKGQYHCIMVHRLVADNFIKNPKKLDLVDHIDRDPGNNDYRNLRWCTVNQNNANSARFKKHSSKYRGVCRVGKKWRAQIKMDGQTKNLGSFGSPKEAALVYDMAAVAQFEEFAVLNVPFKKRHTKQ